MTPNFSPFPFAHLPRATRAQAAIETAIARHARARRWTGARVERLVGGAVHLVAIGAARGTFDPHPVLAEVRIAEHAIVVAGSGGIRAVAQRILGGTDELAAARPATTAEHAIWSLILAALLADAGIDADVWPLEGGARERHERALALRARDDQLIGRGGLVDETEPTVAGSKRASKPKIAPPAIVADLIGIELALDVAGRPVSTIAWVPSELVLRAPAPRALPGWTFELPVVVARCLLTREAVATLGVRDVVMVEQALALVVFDGEFLLSAPAGAVEARLTSGYVRAVALSDEAGLALTVQLGTTRLSLRRLGELAIGEVVGLGRPLAGPYEIHAGGRLIGHGELVDLEGEVGVRITSLTQE